MPEEQGIEDAAETQRCVAYSDATATMAGSTACAPAIIAIRKLCLN